MCKELILTWQNTETREWLPVGRLSKPNGKYQFKYTLTEPDAKKKGFSGLPGIKGFEELHLSETIFPLFQNKILNKSRPDRKEYLEWLNLNDESYTDFEELARTGGVKVTDNFQLYPVPERSNGTYRVIFFAHGLSHLSDSSKKRVGSLKSGDALYLCADKQNQKDSNALFLRPRDPVESVGYCPRFLAKDFSFLLQNATGVKVTVKKINIDAPDQLKLLCEFESKWPDGFEVFKDK